MLNALKEIQLKEESSVVIVRFMGTSKESSDINSIFKSIEAQLKVIFNIDFNDREYFKYKEKVDNDKNSFKSKLTYVSDKCLQNDRKLIILLDSIDQLSKNDYYLNWFFTQLPKNIKLIYSVLPNFENILINLKKKLNKDENILELQPLKSEKAKEILSKYLTSSNRKLSLEQQKSVDKMIDELDNVNPLQIKLIFDIVSKWRSSEVIPVDFIIRHSSEEIIKYLFIKIETKVFDNQILFKHFLFYLTLFEYRGITENELEDILSIDDQVLDSIFIHSHPPVRRFPIGLLSRLIYELKEYITNKMTDDQNVIAW